MPAGNAVSMSDLATAQPGVAVDLPGTYVVQLIVSDGTLSSDADTCIVKVRRPRKRDQGNGKSVQIK
jgi:hypothetical protein